LGDSATRLSGSMVGVGDNKMSDITIIYINGDQEYLKDNGALGGSYSQSVRYEEGFVVITDAYGGERAIPNSRINEIQIHSERSFW
jgi:hypothetical protein